MRLTSFTDFGLRILMRMARDPDRLFTTEQLARELGPGHTIVTILCDYGHRYKSTLFNRALLERKGLPVPEWIRD